METNIQPNVPMAGTPAPMTSQPSVPVGAKILAVLYYLVSVLLIFAGIVFVFTLSFIGFSGFSFLNPLIGSATGISGVLSGVLVLAWGILNFVTGRGLWTEQQWGKFLAITISALYFIFGVIEIFKFGNSNYISTYVSMVINLFIVFYLSASHAIKNSFQQSSKVATMALPILAIAIYVPIGLGSFKAHTQAQDFAKGLQEEMQRTNTAIQQSNMDCKFYEYTNYDEKNKVLNTQSGTGAYSNPTYHFQITLPQAYTMQEFRGTDYCEDSFAFYKPEDTSISGQLMAINVQPAKGDFNYYFDHEYKYEKNAQMTNTQVAGQPAVKITREPYPTWSRVWYLVIYDGKAYTIFNTQNMTEDQLNTAVASFQLSK